MLPEPFRGLSKTLQQYPAPLAPEHSEAIRCPPPA